MNKKSTVEEYLKGIALLKEFDIICHGSFVVGFPGETRDTVMDTVKLIEESGLDFFRTLLWYCEPITPIWKQREKYGLKGSHFEWSHNTMKAREASGLVEEIFLSIKNSVWLPQYGFDFNTLFHLLQRGIGLNRVKHFLRIFNGGIKDKLIDPGKTEVRGDILTQLEQALTGEDGEDGDISAPLHLSAETYQDLEADFDLD
jgi:hypothetical protein